MKERTLRTRLWRARTLLKTWKRALHARGRVMLNHRHQRLKFAQARGARIQIFCAYHQEWETIGDRGSRGKPGEVPSWAEDNDYRVHPDDAALEYGPVLDDFQPGTDQCSAWNPLADDGDAFALEVAADIVSGPGVGNQQWASWHADGKTFFESNERPDGSADPRAARRRAIVRAAAEMAQ